MGRDHLLGVTLKAMHRHGGSLEALGQHAPSTSCWEQARECLGRTSDSLSGPCSAYTVVL